jgi:hypothetical protein
VSDTHSIPAAGGDLSNDEQAELEDLRAQLQALRGRTHLPADRLAVGLAAVIFVFWGQPTALLVVLLAVLLGLIELIGRPPVLAETAGHVGTG